MLIFFNKAKAISLCDQFKLVCFHEQLTVAFG